MQKTPGGPPASYFPGRGATTHVSRQRDGARPVGQLFREKTQRDNFPGELKCVKTRWDNLWWEAVGAAGELNYVKIQWDNFRYLLRIYYY